MIEEALLQTQTISPCSAIQNPRDYVSVLILNEENAGLVLEKPDRSRWQLVGGELLADAEPMDAIQHFLHEKTGHEAREWFYLGSYQQENEGCLQVGHFFFARGMQRNDIHEIPPAPGAGRWKWVPLAELRRGLLDGRFLNIRYAVNVSLSLLMLPRLCSKNHTV